MTIGKTISGNGIDQASLVEFLTNTITIVNEMKATVNTLRSNLLNRVSGGAGLAEGTNANTLKITNAFGFSLNGLAYYKAATDNIAMTAAAQQAISTYCLYLCSIASNGAVTVTKGTSVATDTAVLPATPASSVAFGYFKVATNGAATFTSGTDDLSKAGVTATYVDLVANNLASEAAVAVATADLSLSV